MVDRFRDNMLGSVASELSLKLSRHSREHTRKRMRKKKISLFLNINAIRNKVVMISLIPKVSVRAGPAGTGAALSRRSRSISLRHSKSQPGEDTLFGI
mgnify:CR=1 FL=1